MNKTIFYPEANKASSYLKAPISQSQKSRDVLRKQLEQMRNLNSLLQQHITKVGINNFKRIERLDAQSQKPNSENQFDLGYTKTSLTASKQLQFQDVTNKEQASSLISRKSFQNSPSKKENFTQRKQLFAKVVSRDKLNSDLEFDCKFNG